MIVDSPRSSNYYINPTAAVGASSGSSHEDQQLSYEEDDDLFDINEATCGQSTINNNINPHDVKRVKRYFNYIFI